MALQPETRPLPGAGFDATPPIARAIAGSEFDSAAPVANPITGAEFANPVVTTQPTARNTVAANTDVTLKAVCTGTAPLAYQWYKGETLQAGKTTDTLVVKAAVATAGSYTCKISNAYGETETAPAIIELA